MGEVSFGSAPREVGTWSSRGFLRQATAWIDAALAAHGSARSGPVERVRVRAWSAILRAPTAAGPVWLKAPADATLFELDIYDVIAKAAPERILKPLAIDRERGWLLLPDGGEPLGVQLGQPHVLAAMEQALPRYAELQIALIPRAEELLEAGVPDMRPQAMPARFDEAVAAIRARVGATTPRRDRELIDQIEARREHFQSLCARLDEAPVEISLDHNDLHQQNVLSGPDGGFRSARFYDWGDSVVAHPFASLMMAGFVADGELPGIERLRHAYLEPFAAWGTRAELVATAELACNVGKVARSLTWQRALSSLGATGRIPDRFRRAPLETLAGVLGNDWLGRN